MKQLIPWLMIVGAGFLAVGCRPMATAAPEERRIPVSVLYGGVHCGAGQQAFRATWIDRPDGVARQGAVPGIQWESEKEGALWLEMGVKPTGGYALELDDPEAVVRGGVAVVSVRWRTPDPNAFVTQALTSPCLVVKLPKAGVKTIHIQDQDGALRATVRVAGNG